MVSKSRKVLGDSRMLRGNHALIPTVSTRARRKAEATQTQWRRISRHDANSRVVNSRPILLQKDGSPGRNAQASASHEQLQYGTAGRRPCFLDLLAILDFTSIATSASTAQRRSMAILKTTALCTLALAAMVLPDHTADAHAFLLLPKTEFITPNKNLYAYTIPGKSVPPENAYFTGNAERNSEGFKKNYKTGNWKNLKEFIFKLQQPSGPYKDRPNGGTAECGFSIPTAAAQPLPAQIEYGNYNLQNREGIHPGPCEAWCDDEIVIPFVEDCRTILFKGIPYAKDKCVGKSRFTFYWVATHFPPFQVYTSCVPLQGAVAGAGAATNMTTAAPAAATTTAPKATTVAPKATTAAPASGNNGKVSSDADQTTTKCKVKKN